MAPLFPCCFRHPCSPSWGERSCGQQAGSATRGVLVRETSVPHFWVWGVALTACPGAVASGVKSGQDSKAQTQEGAPTQGGFNSK